MLLHVVQQKFLHSYKIQQILVFCKQKKINQIDSKIILVPIEIDTQDATIEYKFEILNEALQSFQLKILCTQRIVYRILLQWYAIDSKVITVINQFNVQNFQNQTFSHQNSIANDGFISLISFGCSGPMNFSIIVILVLTKIKSIQASSVSIEILDPSQLNVNILQLGYQIILGPKNFIKYLGNQWERTNFTFKAWQSNQNNFVMIPIQGFDFDNKIYIRLGTKYTITNQYFEYTHSSWTDLYVHNLQSQILFQYIRVPYNLEKIIYNQITHNQFFLENNIAINIDQINQSITKPGNYSLSFPNTIDLIEVKIVGKCQTNSQIQTKFYNGLNPSVIKNYQCDNNMKQFYFSVYYSHGLFYEEEFQIILSQQSCQMYLIMKGTVDEYYELFKVDLI